MCQKYEVNESQAVNVVIPNLKNRDENNASQGDILED